MNDDIIYTLVSSTNRGRYALSDPQGPDLTTGERIALLLAGQWIAGHIEHSSTYEGPGCYHIADFGKRNREAITQEALHSAVQEQIQQGKSLADALSAAIQQTVELFCGYYFVASSDGTVCGLCTGMLVRLI